MNLLVVSYFQVYPFKSGASIAQFGTIEYLSHLCNISLLIAEGYTPTREELVELQALLPKVRIYTVTKNLRSGRNKAILKLLNLARYLKNESQFLLKKYFNKSQRTSLEDEFALSYASLKVYNFHSKQCVEKINEIILKDAIDIVQLEFVENLNLVTAIPSNVKKVFVEHECRTYKIISHLQAKQIESVFTDYVYNLNKCIELSLLEKLDGVITFNESDDLYLRNFLKEKKNDIQFFISPYAVLDRDFRELNSKNFRQPTKLTFVGPEIHFPNKDAVEWFLESSSRNFQKIWTEAIYSGRVEL